MALVRGRGLPPCSRTTTQRRGGLNGEALELYRTTSATGIGVARALVHLGIGCADEGTDRRGARALRGGARHLPRSSAIGAGRRPRSTISLRWHRQQGDFTAVINVFQRGGGACAGVRIPARRASGAAERRDRVAASRSTDRRASRYARKACVWRASWSRAAPRRPHSRSPQKCSLRMGGYDRSRVDAGAADRLRATIGMPADAIWQATRVPVLDELVRKLGPERFQSLSAARPERGRSRRLWTRAIRKLETNGDDEDHEPTGGAVDKPGGHHERSYRRPFQSLGSRRAFCAARHPAAGVDHDRHGERREEHPPVVRAARGALSPTPTPG